MIRKSFFNQSLEIPYVNISYLGSENHIVFLRKLNEKVMKKTPAY